MSSKSNQSSQSNQIKTWNVFYMSGGQPILRLEQVIGSQIAVEGWARGKGVTVVEMREAPPLFSLAGILPARQGKASESYV